MNYFFLGDFLFVPANGNILDDVCVQGAKFKDKSGNSKEAIAAAVAENELNLSDNEGGPTEKSDQLPVVFPKRQGGDMAGDGFVTSVRGLFNTQRKKAKKFVLRTMRGEENEIERSESDVEVSPFARQLTITKAKKLIRRHTKKFDTKGHKGFLFFCRPFFVKII